MRFILVLALVSCCAAMATAEQLRVAVATPDALGADDNARSEAAEYAAIWQSLLSVELANGTLFAVVEREDLPRLSREWEFAGRRFPQTGDLNPAWLAADLLVIGSLALTNSNCHLTLKFINAEDGVIEMEWAETFPAGEMGQRVKALAPQLDDLALRRLARRNIHSLVSILDFESASPFDRSRWMETALARRLRSLLQRQRGMLVIERESVSEWFDEARLKRGGLASDPNARENRWASVRNYVVVSGRITETQPEGQPLAFLIETQIKNLADGALRHVEGMVFHGELEEGLGRWTEEIRLAILKVADETDTERPEPDRTAEALALAGKAVQLMNLRDISTLAFIDNFAWEIPPAAFSHAPHAVAASQRRAAVLRAIQYLMSAQMLDEGNARIKVFLSSLLADRSANKMELALELAEEITWEHPQFESRALWFLADQAPDDKRGEFRQRLITGHPGTWQAKRAGFSMMRELVEKHQGADSLEESVEEFRALMDRSLSWGGYIEGDVLFLFQLTQITGRNPLQRQKQFELRDDASRARGSDVLEEMIRRYPEQAFSLSYFWMYYWDYYTDKQEIIDAWIRRASDSALNTDRDPWVIGVRIDPWRIQLARRLMDAGGHREALAFLELVTNYHSIGGATFMIGECAFALGDYERALRTFQGFDAGHRDAAKFYKDAQAWAEKCRAVLGLPVPADPPPEYSITETSWEWKLPEFSLPPGTVSDMKSDGTHLWIGLKHQTIWSDHNAIGLENNPSLMTEALKQGGLARVNLRTGDTTTFEADGTISHPWVMCLAIAGGRVWVGTYGRGIDVFDQATGQWSNINEADGLPSNFIQSMEADAEHLWIGTGRFGRGGVARFHFETGRVQNYLPGDFQDAPPPAKPVKFMKRAGNRLWCVLPEAIYSYDLDANLWSHRASGSHFTSIAVADGRVWFGADKFRQPGPLCGIEHCNLQGEDWQTLRNVDGLPDIAITAMSSAGDRLVLGTYGLMTLDPITKTLLAGDLRSNRPGGTYVVNSLLVSDGRLWAAFRNENRPRFIHWPPP